MIVVDAQLSGNQLTYFTDKVSAEPTFVAEQKLLLGTLPQSIVLNNARTRAYVAMGGSDVIQQFSIRAGAFRLAPGATPLFQTQTRPFAMALDETANELVVADWGDESIEVFDATTAVRKVRVDLGYGIAKYPATNMERGEFFFFSTKWSNNGTKSCAQCHWDELLVDGFGFGNGATAPTAPHKVTSNFNLMTTDPYFWNGCFGNGTYTSLAADAQSRSNCELIAFGLTEGMASNPATRVGDPGNRVRSAQDADCRPVTVAGQVLPTNFATIAQVIAAQKLVRDQLVRQVTGFSFADVARFVDFYSVHELRLPPNPLTYLAARNELDSATAAKIIQGRTVFRTAGCASCHDPDNTRHPYTDGNNHGSGSTWSAAFVDQYQADQRLLNIIATGIPQVFLEAIPPGAGDREINIHLAPIDFFIPFCFDLDSCLAFEDPLAVRGNNAAETQRLEALVQVNLNNADRGFVPGNVVGQPQSNTPSLRGVWWETAFLRTGNAHSLKESILAPGHPLLGANETGYAVDALGNKDVHGDTSKMTAADFEALSLFVQSIE